MKISKLLVLITIGLLFISCNNPKDITEDNVSRIIRTISADEMMGRHAFSKEIEKTVQFIENEFSEIGLQPLPGSNGYRQNFVVYSISPAEVSIRINETNLNNDDQYFGLLNTEELDWNTENADIVYISSEDNFRNLFREFSSDSSSSLIVVAEEHSKWFHRYRSFFSRFNRTMNLDDKPSDIFVLFDSSVESLNMSWQNNVETIDLHNIAGMVEGHRTDEIVLFSAHYDHIGVISSTNQDSIANGANDNASGVSGVVELARYFESRPKPKRTLYFVAFAGEEVGGYGARHFSEQINPDEIVAMINMEMIGKPAIEGPNTAWITGFNRSNLGEIFQEYTEGDFEFYPDPYPQQNLFYRSDNATLARLGVPAHSISTTPIDVDQDYHKVSDEFKTLNISHTTNTIRAIANASKVIISGKETPTRISLESEDN
ncbi:M20/M25/M40 family metallo-hydrolase [Gracilimonas sp.]|uniref:M20/M25/M40 family metallo-hydrolase n=1 Tax=Gracilimonas sp. TaxID=1974203 RepID=UPI0028718CC5|nr:M20/M25/M40 family metallo-hydrolase [Gracilimonas sp.]